MASGVAISVPFLISRFGDAMLRPKPHPGQSAVNPLPQGEKTLRQKSRAAGATAGRCRAILAGMRASALALSNPSRPASLAIAPPRDGPVTASGRPFPKNCATRSAKCPISSSRDPSGAAAAYCPGQPVGQRGLAEAELGGFLQAQLGLGDLADLAGQADLHEIDHVGAGGLLGGGGGQRGLGTSSQVPAWRVREVVARLG